MVLHAYVSGFIVICSQTNNLTLELVSYKLTPPYVCCIVCIDMFGRQLVLLEHVYTFTKLHSKTSQETNYDNLLLKINVN